MNIFFQFGEFSTEEGSKLLDFIVQIFAALIGAASAIGVLYLTFDKQKKKDTALKVELNQDKLRYVHYLITNSIEDSSRQIKNIDNFLKEFEKNYSKIPYYDIVLKNNVEKITKNINQEDHFLAYVREVKDDNIAKIFSLSEYFNNTFNVIYEDLKSNARYDHELRLPFRDGLNQLIKDISSYTFGMKAELRHTEPLFDILNNALGIYRERLEIDAGDYLSVRIEFIDPLMNLLIPYRGIDKINEIFKLSGDMKKLLEAVLVNNQKTFNKLTDYKKDLQGQLELLKRLLLPLDKYLKDNNMTIIPLEAK